MKLTDLPEEVLIQIFSDVYEPWWIEARCKYERESGPGIMAKPNPPPLSPLLVCRAVHRVSRDMPLQSFIGLIDVYRYTFTTSDWEKWAFVRPSIDRVWIEISDYITWGLFLAPLSSVRYIELFDRSHTNEMLSDTFSCGIAGLEFPPKISEMRESFWKLEELKELMQEICHLHGNTLHKDLQICQHQTYLYRRRGESPPIDVAEASKGDATLLEVIDVHYLDLVYDLYKDGHINEKHELLSYSTRVNNCSTGIWKTITEGRSEWCCLGKPKGFVLPSEPDK